MIPRALLLLQLIHFAFGFERYKTYWNVPSVKCMEDGVPINLDNGRIIHNTGHLFQGEYADRIVVLYENKFGTWPEIRILENGTRKIINGGVPQAADLNLHLRAVEKSIESLIPDETFNGIAVIDMEIWRPQYDMNYGDRQKIYRDYSLQMAALNMGLKLNDKTRPLIENRARKHFEKGAMKFFMKTLAKCKKMRPNAKWGFYLFPFVDYAAGRTADSLWASERTQKANDKLRDFFNQLDILTPSIYLYDTSEEAPNGTIIFPNTEYPFRRIRAIVNETLRVRKSLDSWKPILLYTIFETGVYNSSLWGVFYNKNQLCSSIRMPADLGVDGLIYWSTDRGLKERCPLIAPYVNDVLVPYIRHTTKHVGDCSVKVCSGHGMCVNENIGTATECQEYSNDKYTCECDYGWSGPSCNATATDELN